MLIIFPAAAAYFVIKGIGAQQKASSPLVASSNATAAAGNAPPNGMPASPSPPTSADALGAAPAVFYDPRLDSYDDDDGPMSATVRAVASADGTAPSVGDYDGNVTQNDSGQDNPSSDLWRARQRGGYGAKLMSIWDDLCDVDYISPSPSVQFPFQPPGMIRQDNDPRLNRQPWARDVGFMATDPTQVFETDGDGIPSAGNDEESEDD